MGVVPLSWPVLINFENSQQQITVLNQEDNHKTASLPWLIKSELVSTKSLYVKSNTRFCIHYKIPETVLTFSCKIRQDITPFNFSLCQYKFENKDFIANVSKLRETLVHPKVIRD